MVYINFVTANIFTGNRSTFLPFLRPRKNDLPLEISFLLLNAEDVRQNRK